MGAPRKGELWCRYWKPRSWSVTRTVSHDYGTSGTSQSGKVFERIMPPPSPTAIPSSRNLGQVIPRFSGAWFSVRVICVTGRKCSDNLAHSLSNDEHSGYAGLATVNRYTESRFGAANSADPEELLKMAQSDIGCDIRLLALAVTANNELNNHIFASPRNVRSVSR